MKLYWGKHTCAIGIHVLLEEIGARSTLEEVDVLGQENRGEPFKAINPKRRCRSWCATTAPPHRVRRHRRPGWPWPTPRPG